MVIDICSHCGDEGIHYNFFDEFAFLLDCFNTTWKNYTLLDAQIHSKYRITYFSRWGFEYSLCPMGGEFDFSKIQIPTLAQEGGSGG